MERARIDRVQQLIDDEAVRRYPADAVPRLTILRHGVLDPEEDEIARGLTPVMAPLGPVDTETLDTLITSGIVTSRSEAARWALARVREQPAYAELSERAREPGDRHGRPGMERAVQDRLQTELEEQVKERFPDGEVQRVALLQYGDDPWVEPGDLLVRVSSSGSAEKPGTKAGPGSGSAGRLTGQPGASAISPRLMSGSDPRT